MDRRSRVRKTEMHAQASKIAASGRRLPLTEPGMLHRARHRALSASLGSPREARPAPGCCLHSDGLRVPPARESASSSERPQRGVSPTARQGLPGWERKRFQGVHLCSGALFSCCAGLVNHSAFWGFRCRCDSLAETARRRSEIAAGKRGDVGTVFGAELPAQRRPQSRGCGRPAMGPAARRRACVPTLPATAQLTYS